MVQTVIMPKLGQTVEESTLVKWRKREGDLVTRGEILFEIETDKAVLEIESFFEGTLLKIIVAEGETVPVMIPVAFIGSPGDQIPEVKPLPLSRPAAESAVAVPPAPALRSALAKEGLPAIAPGATAGPSSVVRHPSSVVCRPSSVPISPRARRLIRECAISAERIAGAGPDGRIVEKDVRAYLETRNYAALKITPAALGLARENDIDILAVPRANEQERLTVEMIRQAIAEKPKPLNRMRQTIARRLTESFTTMPHFYVTV
ncbi:MAG: E3 binding domain-containing protein, partial [Lentisphaerae bacterium]|nr:E3 binding domain-containing protein [Lentisphaerota bacterium]